MWEEEDPREANEAENKAGMSWRTSLSPNEAELRPDNVQNARLPSDLAAQLDLLRRGLWEGHGGW